MKTYPIVLVAINARYSHAGLGARFLLANMDAELRRRTFFIEGTINDPVEDLASRIIACRPRIVGVGVYIWNRARVEALLPRVRSALPSAQWVLGGPEISYDTESPLARSADCVIRGEGELLWPAVCRARLEGRAIPRRPPPETARPDAIRIPDNEYNDTDIRTKNIYIETTRGCPFACDFCLSSIHRGVRFFPTHTVLEALQRLLDRGCRRFRFVDRSFNTGGEHAARILEFFHARLRPGLRLHFEMTPDGLRPALRRILCRFPPGVLHIETGVQSFHPDVLQRVSRSGCPDDGAEGIDWLVRTARADVHADLIAGLPGETLESFRAGFDRLYRLGPAEIQVGILKKLHGAPIERHEVPFALRFRPEPPYDVCETAHMSARDLDDIRRFASHWERVVNRRHFPRTIDRLLTDADSPWRHFDAFSRRLERLHGRYGFDIIETAAVLLDFLTTAGGVSPEDARALLRADVRCGGKRVTLPRFLR